MKKLTISIAAVVVGAALAAGGTALAHGKGGGPRGTSFEKLDADGNGQVTLTELTQNKEAWLKRADADGNGQVTRAELQANRQAQHEQRAQKRFEKQDQNGDGKITKDESQIPERFFEKLDENSDGAITLDEMQKRHANKGPRRGKKASRQAEQSGKHARAERSGRLGRMDENGDGTITLAEAQSAAARQLERWDRNADGVISKDELPRGSRHHGKRGKRGKRGGGRHGAGQPAGDQK